MNTLLHFCRFLAGMDSPETQVSERELDMLRRYARDAKVAVEIGTFEGRTSAALAPVVAGTLFSVDPFPAGRIGVCYGEWIAKINARRSAIKNVRFVKGFSHDVAPGFGEPIDFLFIDADHSYEAVRRDWDDWVSKVVDGGVVALHDCKVSPNSPDYLGSMRFYDDDLPSKAGVREVDAVDSLVVLRVER
jgi:predicted O-methyltransferase YrrM